VREVLASAWKAYSTQAGDETSGDGFRAWLEQNKDQQGEALAYITSLRGMVASIKSIGLSSLEQAHSLKTAIDPLMVGGGLQRKEVEQMLGVDLS